MDFSSPTVIGLIVAILVAVLFFILFLIANHSKKKVKNQTEAHYKEKEQHHTNKQSNLASASSSPKTAIRKIKETMTCST